MSKKVAKLFVKCIGMLYLFGLHNNKKKANGFLFPLFLLI